jgi:hypothetical protein
MDPFAVNLVRGICKSYFDFLRNLAIIGALKYVADKTGSALFEAVYWISVVALFLNIHMGTFNSWWIRPFKFEGRKGLAAVLNFFAHAFLSLAFVIGRMALVNQIVSGIVAAH